MCTNLKTVMKFDIQQCINSIESGDVIKVTLFDLLYFQV